MIVVEHGGVELDHCLECGGTWFDRDELGLLLEGLGAEARAAAEGELADLAEVKTDEARRRCPICRVRMLKVNMGGEGGVLIDACRRGHGLWFDDTEVVRLAEQIAKNVPQAQGKAIEFMGRVFCGPKEPERKEER